MNEQGQPDPNAYRWSAATIKKAKRLLEDGGVTRDPDQPMVFWVRASTPDAPPYRVQTDGSVWISCGCPNGQRRAQVTCYHSASVVMYLRGQEESHEASGSA